MGDQLTEVYDQSVSCQRRTYYPQVASISGTVNLVITKTNRHLLTEKPVCTGAVHLGENAATQVNPTLILRYDLILEEDLWLKKLAAVFAFLNAIATTNWSCEMAVTYTPPTTNAQPIPIYDETLTSANLTAASNVFQFDMPSRSMYQLLAKGGLLNFVLTFNQTSASGNFTFLLAAVFGLFSYIELDVTPANSSKDTEITSEHAT